jgi:hypothetical protein
MNQEKKTTVQYLENHIKSNGYSSVSVSLDLVDNQKTLFDSILYHLSSIYDYYAILSDYIYNYKSNLKWNGLFNSANDKTNTKISESHKKLIIKAHKEFVNSVFSHRSFLIHNSTSNPGYLINEYLMLDKVDIKLLTPQKLINEFKELKELVKDDQITLEASLFWVLNKGLSNIVTLLYGLKLEINNNRKLNDKDAFLVNNSNTLENGIQDLWVKE